MEKSSVIPKKMRYISHASSQLQIQYTETPTLSAKQVLIKVHAFGVNRADILQKQGRYPAPEGDSEILGLEVSGTIVQVASSELEHLLGDQVFCLTSGGGYAEYVIAQSELLMPLTEGLSLSYAAGLAEVYLTAYDAIVRTGQLNSNGVLLCHGGASGVGSAAIRIAKRLGATVITTQSSKEKAKYAKALGADYTINYLDCDFAEEMKKLGLKANVILDPVGGEYLRANLRVAAMDCHCVMLAMLGGRYTELDFAKLLAKRFNLHGSTLRNRSLDYKTELVKDFLNEFGSDLPDQTMKIPIYKELYWDEIEQAHDILEHNQNLGKVIVRVS
ncbi:NAD(P)H-quinone oxidoreductase [Pseudoalteromonas sp. JC28]|uniref:NAD(P)H-quinone oxidoreductase n=1 Tax=Pseudoalteromonas sp. JC28 TaxID=2267617 RepID=UPI001574E1A6|nr:NAD(P)H-quinone oxidoreductase [Pseudoalteromonas sp. JC28]NSY32873.1 NAD(P)H-quinone oxidoreductase [Pseudoalteromonas sp. JC28]